MTLLGKILMVRGLLATFLAYASNSAGVGNGADLILCVVSPEVKNRIDRRQEAESKRRQRVGEKIRERH